MGGIFKTIDLGFSPSPDVAAEVASFALEFVREVTPVRTGRLRGGWDVTIEGSNLNLSNQVPYASFVDNGTSRMRAREMTSQTLEAVKPFAERRNRLALLLENEKLLQFEGTGNKQLDAAILDAASQIVGNVSAEGRQTGLFDVGLKTLLTFNDAARPAPASRDQVLRDLYGVVAESLGIGPVVETRQ